MVDRAPLARSPIDPAPPVAVVDGWEVSDRHSSAALRIVDCTPLAKVLVRADGDGEAARTLDVGFGNARRDAIGTLVVGDGPDEWILLAPPGSAPTLAQRLDDLASGEFVSVLDVTHVRALIRLTGEDAVHLLAKVCAIDLDEQVTPNGAAFRSSVAEVVTDVIRDDQASARSYLLHCERSFGQYLFDALVDAGNEFGIDIDGFRPPGI